jgi:GPH family glycoside/pentoside/hexuronide:cation symporter
MTAVEQFFHNFFLTNIAEFSLGLTATVGLIITVTDTVTSWIPGAFLNYVKPGKFGRYRTWLLLLPWTIPILYTFGFVKIGNDMLAAVIICAGLILAHFLWNIPWVANLTLISVCGKTIEGRARMASQRATWTQFSGLIFGYVGLPLATFLGPIIGEHNRFAGVAFITGCFVVFGYFVNFLSTTGLEDIESAEDLKKKQSKTKASGKDMVQALVKNQHLVCLLLADFPRFLTRFVTMGTVAYYFMYVAQNMAMMGTYMVVAHGIGNLTGAFLSGVVAKKFAGRTSLISCYIIVIAMLIIVYLNYLNPWVMIVCMFIGNMSMGFCTAASIACYADTAVYAQWKFGTDSRGWIMGLATMPLKIGVIGRATVINIVLAVIGFNVAAIRADPSLVTSELQRGITAGFTLVPIAFLVPGILLLVFGYKLTRAKIIQYQEEIAARAAKP